jgi:hypothetical protein
MFYVFLLAIAAAGVGIYLLLVMLAVPGFKEQRFGVLEPLPPNLGEWQLDTHSTEARLAASRGEKREQRFLFEEGGLLGRGRLVQQVRYRDDSTNTIVRVDPERVVKRKRRSAAG